jgi:nicotinate phosphoribosyltransferase
VAPQAPLAELREHARRQLAALPPALRGLDPAPAYPVIVSESLRELACAVDRRTTAGAA